jgi:hypothetical protein
MSETVRTFQEKYVQRSERAEEQATSIPSRINFKPGISFLSLKEAVNSYPDTGESGDAYNVEAT